MKRLIHIQGNKIVRQISLDKPEYTLGRGAECDIVFETPKVSRIHARLIRDGETYRIVDHGSTNHVFVNGRQSQTERLATGDEITLSKEVSLIYLGQSAADDMGGDVLQYLWNFINKKDFLRLKEVTNRILALDSLEHILNLVLEEVVQLVCAERGFIALVDEVGTIQIDHSVSHNIPLQQSRDNDASIFSHSTVQQAIQSRKDVFLFNVGHNTELLSNSVTELELQSLMCSPLLVGHHLVGILYVDSGFQLSDFNEMDQFFFTILADHAALAIQNATLYNRAQMTVQQLRTEIQAGEERYRLLFESMLNGFAFFEAVYDDEGRLCDGCYIDMNPAYEAFTGLHKASALGRCVMEMMPGTERHWFEQFDIVVKTGHPMYFEMFHGFSHKHYAVSAYRPRHHTFAAIFEDITERKAAEDAMHAAKEKAQEAQKRAEEAQQVAEAADRAKSEFLANMSHEIRTPMNAVLGFTELLDERITDPKQKNYVSSIKSGGKNLLTLINDILDLSKIEAGKMDLNAKPVSLINLLQELRGMFTLAVQQKRLDWLVEYDTVAAERLVLLDEVRMRQVLFNLLGNAVKFTENGSIKIVVTISLIPHNADRVNVCILVEDSGIGIPEDQQTLIFEVFRQQDGQLTRKYGGTGLGLAITKRLVEMMGGTITVRSHPGAGSCFTVCLPEIPLAPTTSGQLQQSEDELCRCDFDPATLLVVDDMPHNRELIKEFLRDTRFVVHEAEHGAQAVRLAEQYQPDLILMDLCMPVLDGYAATLQIKASADLRMTPVVAMTAAAMLDEREKIQAAAFDGYLQKPVSHAALCEELGRFLAHWDPPAMSGQSSSVADHSSESAPVSGVSQQFSELIPSLEQHGALLCREALESGSFQQIEVFGEYIFELGNDYAAEVLRTFGEKLLQHVRHFDVEQIGKQLNSYPALLETVRQWTETCRNTGGTANG